MHTPPATIFCTWGVCQSSTCGTAGTTDWIASILAVTPEGKDLCKRHHNPTAVFHTGERQPTKLFNAESETSAAKTQGMTEQESLIKNLEPDTPKPLNCRYLYAHHNRGSTDLDYVTLVAVISSSPMTYGTLSTRGRQGLSSVEPPSIPDVEQSLTNGEALSSPGGITHMAVKKVVDVGYGASVTASSKHRTLWQRTYADGFPTRAEISPTTSPTTCRNTSFRLGIINLSNYDYSFATVEIAKAIKDARRTKGSHPIS